MPDAIQTFSLTKTFPQPLNLLQIFYLSKRPPSKIAALKDVTLNVEKGEIFGLLGPNGAGKTTLLKILSTLIIPDAGEAIVNGYNLSDEENVKASIGLVSSEERSFYWRLTGRENLQFFASLYNFSLAQTKKNIERLTGLLDLEDFLDRRFNTYSSGMKQRLNIARALLHNPAILFLDEPTKDLDPLAAKTLRDYIRRLSQQEGHTVILITHRLEEAKELCHRIGIMHKGCLRVADTIQNLSLDEVFQKIIAQTIPENSSSVSLKRKPDIVKLKKASLKSIFSFSLPVFWQKALAFLKRDFKTELSYRLAFILQFLGIIFSVASFFFIARLFGERASPYLQIYGGNYFPFVLIGIAFLGYQSVAMYTFSGSIRNEQTLGTLEAMLTSPTPLSHILICSSLKDFFLTSFMVIFYLIIGAVIFGVTLSNMNILAAIIILLLTIIVFSSIGIISAAFIIVFKRGNPLDFFFGSLSSLLGGVYYPIEILPGWLKSLSFLFPITHSLKAMRLALLQGYTLPMLISEITTLGIFAITLFPLSLFIFGKAVRKAKKDGSLVQY